MLAIESDNVPDVTVKADALKSGGSDDGGSEPNEDFSGVRNGDLKGL